MPKGKSEKGCSQRYSTSWGYCELRHALPTIYEKTERRLHGVTGDFQAYSRSPSLLHSQRVCGLEIQ